MSESQLTAAVGSSVNLAALLIAAGALSVERICYVFIARAPAAFRMLCARPLVARHGAPITIVETLFYAFKIVQFAVFVAWCWTHGDGSFVAPEPRLLAVAVPLVVTGQVLNLAVFVRLGRLGVFFGDRLGYALRQCREFPFSLVSHPQYVGTVLTIWGFFLAARFPHGDWYALPVLETVYYAVGARLEARPPATPADIVQPVRPGHDIGRYRHLVSRMLFLAPPGRGGQRRSNEQASLCEFR